MPSAFLTRLSKPFGPSAPLVTPYHPAVLSREPEMVQPATDLSLLAQAGVEQADAVARKNKSKRSGGFVDATLLAAEMQKQELLALSRAPVTASTAPLGTDRLTADAQPTRRPLPTPPSATPSILSAGSPFPTPPSPSSVLDAHILTSPALTVTDEEGQMTPIIQTPELEPSVGLCGRASPAVVAYRAPSERGEAQQNALGLSFRDVESADEDELALEVSMWSMSSVDSEEFEDTASSGIKGLLGRCLRLGH